MDIISEYWEGIIGLLALATAVASTIVSFYTFKLQRTHNIKSVKPIIHIGQWDYENCLIVTLKNVGYGIGLVKKLSVYNIKNDVKNSIYDWLPKTLPGKMNYKEYWTPYAGFVIQGGETIKLIEIPIDTAKGKQLKERENLRKTLGQLSVQVEYEDIYENKMPVKRLQLVHFLRPDNEN